MGLPSLTHTRRLRGPVKVRCESRNALERGRYMRLKIGQIHFQWRGDRWPCWIRFRLFPRASALGKRCTVVDTVSKQYRTPPRSVTQRARGSNPGRTVMCLHPCGARRLLLQRSASTVEGILNSPSPSRGRAAHAAHAAALAAFIICLRTAHLASLRPARHP